MQSMRSFVNMLKKMTKEKTTGGQLALVREDMLAECGRVSARETMKKEAVGGRLAPATKHAMLGRPQREPHPDPYYGHETTAKMSARFIHDLFKCSQSFARAGIPEDAYPTLDQFIAYALFRSESDRYVHYYALYLIWRMHIRCPDLRAHHSHETYLAALMVATRMISPEDYALKSWTEVGQSIYSLEYLLSSERGVCAMVGWNVEVGSMLVEMIESQVEMKYGEPETCSEEWSESSEECDSDSDDSSSLFDVETPNASPYTSDSDSYSSPLSQSKPTGECVWW